MAESVSLAKQVVYLAPSILAKLDADPAIRQAVLALIERDVLSWQPRPVSRSGPIRSVPVRSSRPAGSGLFEALKKGVPTVFLTASCTRLQQVERLRLETSPSLARFSGS